MSDEASGQPPLHEPVLAREVLELLDPSPDAVLLDCTFGTGGHAKRLTDRLSSNGNYVALDWDPESKERAPFDEDELECEFVFRTANFVRSKQVLHELNLQRVDGLLADLGWSTDQIKSGGRGLTFEKDEFLDMRYNPDANKPAADLLHEWSAQQLSELFRKHGEHRYGRKLAEKIVEQRRHRPMRRTLDLLDLIESTVGAEQTLDTAARVFQALRTEVNNELENLERLLHQLPELLAPGGRSCVISFHSLEDRRVKQSFQKGHRKGLYELLTEKPVRPERDTVEQNPSSRSARLRAVERSRHD